MNKKPFFSIIIPVLNGEETIGNCLESILNQDFKDYEVLIIDSLSTDGTIKTVNEFIRTSTSLKLFIIKSSIYEAMNYGIKESNGQYLYFMGCDDILFNNQVLNSVALSIQDTLGVHIVYGNVLFGNGTRLYDGAFTLTKLYHRNICHQSMFYSKAVFDIVGFYDRTYFVHADWHFNFRCFSTSSLNIAYVNHLIAIYSGNGFSTKNVDSLIAHRNEIFMAIAKKADIKQYLKLNLDIRKTKRLLDKMKYIYFVLLFCLVFV